MSVPDPDPERRADLKAPVRAVKVVEHYRNSAADFQTFSAEDASSQVNNLWLLTRPTLLLRTTP
jgi:hypothetical protein